MQTTNNGTFQTPIHEQQLQMLSDILIQINALQALVQESTPDIQTVRRNVTELEQMAHTLMHTMRTTSENISLPELSGVSLSEALSRIVEETAEATGLSSRLTFSGEERVLPPLTEQLFYRVAQEALYQVQQHSGVHRLRFTLNYGRDDVQMNIEDDGFLPSRASAEDETPVGAQFIAPPAENVPMPYFQTPSPTDTIFNALRHRIEHLHGSLEVTSSLEQGTRVLVRIPSIPERETLPMAPIANPSTTQQVHVLIVDNQTVTRTGLRRLLESYPDIQIVGEAVDGVQAVSETLELGPQLVLMDTQLPNGQSMEALRQIKQLNLETHVLLLSSNDREDYLYETLRAGADGYVLKDIAPDELAQAIRTVARGEMLIQPQLASKLLFRAGQQGHTHAPYETLTAREQEVLQLLARGLRNKEIAARLYVSERTVTFHLQNIYQKLHVSGRTEALSKALEQGLLKS